MTRLFGTDGVRGVANEELTPELAYQLGRAGAHVLTGGATRPRILVCRDTRISGGMLEAALAAGIASAGADAVLLGVLPTPGCAILVQRMHADAGVMISASHNPVADNGIKFFSSTGYKLPDHVEDEIERNLHGDGLPRPTGPDVGRIYQDPSAAEAYGDFLIEEAGSALDGMHIAVDCAHGAACQVVPRVFHTLGARLDMVCSAPDGVNINHQCGSTQPETILQFRHQTGAQVGITYDGDADRVLMVDEQGDLVDGDAILAICARQYMERGELRGSKVAATVYSNGGLQRCLEDMGAGLEVTKAGDRYVLEAMQNQQLVLGGEQSGHIIFLDHSTTGDGILTSLKVLQAMVETGQPLCQLRRILTVYPQQLVNVKVRTKMGWDTNVVVQDAIKAAEDRLAPQGRIFVRPSGTEPLIRVMAEHPREGQAREAAAMTADCIKQQLG